MIIRATILVFALMLYIMVTAGGHTTRAASSPDTDDSSPTSAYNPPEITVQGARSPEGRIDFALLDETALQGLTYAAAERAISEQLTGKSAAHGPQMKVRQALILGCGLMMREARSMEVESRGKFEKLDLHRAPADSSPSISVPTALERTY